MTCYKPIAFRTVGRTTQKYFIFCKAYAAKVLRDIVRYHISWQHLIKFEFVENYTEAVTGKFLLKRVRGI